MASTDIELRNEVRTFADYTVEEIDQSGLETDIDRAKSHLLIETDLEDLDEPDWYDTEFPKREEALFWTTLLFSKLTTGELDSKSFTVGAIKEKELLAKAGQDTTLWYSNYKRYRDLLIESNKTSSRARRVSRTTRDGDRYYGR